MNQQYISLADQVDKTKTELLNTLLQSISGIKSQEGEEFILNVGFINKVKIHSLKLSVKKEHLKNAPKEILLFNRAVGGFDDENSVQIFDLTEEKWKASANVTTVNAGDNKAGTDSSRHTLILETKFVKFQNVDFIGIYVKSNVGDEEQTCLDGVDFYGSLLEQTKDLKELNNKNDQE